MVGPRISSGILIWLNRFRRDQKGVAAIEFALIVPVLIGFYLMLNETANGMRASRKVTMVSRVMADLATRPSDLTTAMQNDIFASASPIMNPFTVSQMGMRLTSIRFDAAGRGTVDWSLSRGPGLGAYARCTSTDSVAGVAGITIPTALRTPNTSLVLAEATLPYKPVVGELITGDINLRDRLYMRPRISDFVTLNGTVNASCA
jgi:Flp pilus assembly protein TadG